ncbi:MAG: hybrid sensor histidine kinase/response regulator [Bacteroidales bacterium]
MEERNREIGVLVAEEDFQLNRSLVNTLQKSGFRVAGCAYDGRMALDMHHLLKPDVLLINVSLPLVSGLDVARILSEKSPLPLVAMTPVPEDRDLMEMIHTSGFGACISNQAGSGEIRRAISFALAGRKRQLEWEDRTILLQEEIDRLKQDLDVMEGALTERNRILSLVTHELKNPLGSLLGLVEVLQRKYDAYDDETRLDLLADIFGSGKDTYQLLESLLLWTRLSNGKMAMRPVEVNISGLTGNLMDTFSPMAGCKQIALRNLTGADQTVVGDLFVLQTILRNLISNAIQFTGKNGEVKVSAHQVRDWTQIVVSDNGTGLEPDVLRDILSNERNHSTTGTAGEPGTGLGLSICQDMARKLGGRISAKSEPGKGSTFTVWIPCPGIWK